MTQTLTLRFGDCVKVLREYEEGSVGAVLCDPPYHISFMGKSWDAEEAGIAFSLPMWDEIYRVLRPGGVVKAFSGTRTFHRMVTTMVEVGLIGVRLEAWAYGSGFPKSLNIGKSMDRAAGAEREIIGTKRGVGGENMNDIVHGREIRTHEDEGGKGVGAYGTGAKQVAIDIPVTAPATEAAKRFEAWGTALKPSWEPIVVGRKPE